MASKKVETQEVSSTDALHPSHYRGAKVWVEDLGEWVDITCFDVIENFTDVRLANAVRYIWRVGLGGGKADNREDIGKAIVYLERWLSHGPEAE